MKTIFAFILLCYTIFFILTQPAQTPDEMGHYETVYWVSRFIYPLVHPDFRPNPRPYGADIASLFNFGNENPMLVLNFQTIRNSPLQQKPTYSIDEEQQFIPESGQAYNPPLYYIIGGIFLRVAQMISANIIAQFYAVRMASGMFYFLTVFVCYHIFIHVFSKPAAKHIVLFFALNPLFMQSGIGISPDISVAFFSSLFVWITLRRSTSLLQPQTLVILGLICGLATLCKISGIFLVLAFIAYLFIHTKKFKPWIIACAIFCATFVVTQIPWITLNMIRYQKLVVDSIALGLPESTTYSISLPAAIMATLLDFRHTIMHFSGFLGWNDAFPFPPIFFGYTLIFCGLLSLGMYHAWKKKAYQFMILSLGSLFIFFFFLALQRKMHFHPGWGIGGRNILPVFPQMIIFISLIFQRKSFLLSYFAIFYYFYIVIFVLLPRYYV